MSTFPLLQTPRLILRPFEGGDCHAVFEIFTHPEVARHHNIERMTGIEQAHALVRYRRALWEAGEGVRWALVRPERPLQCIGCCGFDFSRRRDGAIELGYDLHPDHWGVGLAREALCSVIACAFAGRLGMRVMRVEAFTRPDNERSQRLLASLGFVHEGVLRRYRRWHRAPVDLQCHSLLFDDPVPLPGRGAGKSMEPTALASRGCTSKCGSDGQPAERTA